MTSMSTPKLESTGSTTAAVSAVELENAAAMEDVRNLTDIGAMTQILHESVADQRALDQQLEFIVSQRSDLDMHLLTLQQSAGDVLHRIVKSDSDYLLANLISTSDLADLISANVRLLDRAQSRVHDTLLRVEDAIGRSYCLQVVRKALLLSSEEDLETAADHIKTFLQIDARYEFDGSSSDEREELLSCLKQLQAIVRKKFSAAVDHRDHPAILRFIKLYPPLGLEEEGLQAYVSYLKKVISMRSRLEFEQLVDLIANNNYHNSNHRNDSSEVDFVSCLTNLFKDIVLAIEENGEVLRSLCGEDGVVYAICELQQECDSRAYLIVNKYIEYRKLENLTCEINSHKTSSSGNMLDPRDIELYLEEMLSLMQLGEDYTQYMVSKIRGLSSVDIEFVHRAVTAFRSGRFAKTVQDVTGYYVILEGYFMVENVSKAIKIDEHVVDSLTTSVVNDVFYVLQSCCRRTISTSNINSVIAVISNAVSLLGGEYYEALQETMRREGNLGAKLFLGGSAVLKTGTEVASALNNMDMSSEYALKLRHEIEENCTKVFTSSADRDRVKSCLSELNEMSDTFKKALCIGMEQLVATITPRIRPVLDNVATISYELSEAEYSDNEVNDPWVRTLLHTIDTNLAWLQPLMTANNYDSLMHLVIDFIVKRLEIIMMQKRFNQLGGLQLDRDVRTLISHLSSMTQRTVRDKFARLTQIATILNLEKVSEILQFWGENSGPMTWRFTPAEVRRVLSLRIDFSPEAIAALKL